LDGEEVVSIRLVPSLDSTGNSTSGSGVGIAAADEEKTPYPAVMFLTQSSRVLDSGYPLELQLRSLQLLQCPTTPITQWALEIGAMPDPHPVYDCMPWVAPITVRDTLE